MGLNGTMLDNLGRDSGQIKLKSELGGRAFAQRVFSWSSSWLEIQILLLLHLKKKLKILFKKNFFRAIFGDSLVRFG